MTAKKATARRAGTKPATRRRPATSVRKTPAAVEIHEIESLRQQVDRLAARSDPPRWNANPDDVKRSVLKLVLTLVEFIRQLLERQAIRRMEASTLTGEETEAIGLALMRLEETIVDLGAQFGIAREDLNLDLGPIGKLM